MDDEGGLTVGVGGTGQGKAVGKKGGITVTEQQFKKKESDRLTVLVHGFLKNWGCVVYSLGSQGTSHVINLSKNI